MLHLRRLCVAWSASITGFAKAQRYHNICYLAHMAKTKRRTAATDAEAAPKRSQRAKKEKIEEPEKEQPEKGCDIFYLLKSEPHEFSIDDLAAAKDQTEPWDGVRNYQARNIMKGMRLGNRAFFYHSNCKEPGIVGICEVAREAYPDHTALDPGSKKYDPKATAEDPRWYMVDVKMVRPLARLVSLRELKQHSETELKGMALLTKGRLSVQPVTQQQWDFVLGLEHKPAEEA